MPVMSSCCFMKSVKTGSYVCGIYTLILYTVLFIVGTCHAMTVREASLLGLCLMMVTLNASCAISSAIMLVGLYKDNRLLLLPWTVAISMTTLIDVMVSFYLIKDAVTDPFLAVLFVIDVLITAINVYALLCVLSQYREYKAGTVGEFHIQQPHQMKGNQTQPKTHVTSSITDDVTSSNAFLLPTTSKSNNEGNNSTPHPTGAKTTCCELATISEEKAGTPKTSNSEPDTAIAETSFQNEAGAHLCTNPETSTSSSSSQQKSQSFQ